MDLIFFVGRRVFLFTFSLTAVVLWLFLRNLIDFILFGSDILFMVKVEIILGRFIGLYGLLCKCDRHEFIEKEIFTARLSGFMKELKNKIDLTQIEILFPHYSHNPHSL